MHGKEHAMTLTISDTIIDEEFRTIQTGTADDNDVTAAIFNSSSFSTALGLLGLTFVTSPTGFPQYAEKTSFVTFDKPVTDFFLTSSNTGTPFPATGTATTL